MSCYYLNSDNQPVGPMDLAAIRKLVAVGFLPCDVLVCEAGGSDWSPLSQMQGPTGQAEIPKPPRTPPQSRHSQRMAEAPQPVRAPSAKGNPDWFPLTSMVAGVVALIALCVPLLSILFGGGALTLGILGYRSPQQRGRPFAIAGIATSSVALVASLGVVLYGAGMFGNPEARYVGSWKNDMSMQIMNLQVDHAIVVTFHENGRFTEHTGEQFNGANYDTGQAIRMAGGAETTGYWKWDPARKALVTRYDGRNHTGYFEGATDDGRSLSVSPFDAGPSSMKAQEEFWVFKPDPDDRNVLIGVHPTTYHHRTMRFYRLD